MLSLALGLVEVQLTNGNAIEWLVKLDPPYLLAK
jgi:hypothetical protein